MVKPTLQHGSKNTNWEKVFGAHDLHFPKGSVLHPLINRKKVKLSYRCFPNMCATISRHNKKILNNEQYKQRCQGKIQSTCPIPGKCATVKVIYRATVSTANDVETYVDLTAGPFKARFSKHKSDFFAMKTRGVQPPFLSIFGG